MAAVGATKLHVSGEGVQRGCRLQDARMMRHDCQIVPEVWGLMPLLPFCVPCLSLGQLCARNYNWANVRLAWVVPGQDSVGLARKVLKRI